MARPIFMNFIQALESDENSGYDYQIKFPKMPKGLQEFIDCAKYKQGEPENELEERID